MTSAYYTANAAIAPKRQPRRLRRTSTRHDGAPGAERRIGAARNLPPPETLVARKIEVRMSSATRNRVHVVVETRHRRHDDTTRPQRAPTGEPITWRVASPFRG